MLRTKSLKIFWRLVCPALSLFFMACSGGGAGNTFSNPSAVAIDSTNDRIFISEPAGIFFAYTASTFTGLGDQPLVDSETATDIYDLLPGTVTRMAVYANGSSSRLFIFGSFDDDSGNAVFNRVLVLDFDGVSFAQSDISPIILSDSDDATDETDDSIADAIVDQTNGLLYVSDASAGKVFVVSTSDGSAVDSYVVAGEPQGIALCDDRLYVCNSSSVAEEQVVSVINVTDDSTSSIDIGSTCSRLEVKSNDSMTLLIAKDNDANQVFLESVDTSTFAAVTAVTSASTDYADGVLSAGAGISSTIEDFQIGKTSSGTLTAYFSEEDGNIEYIEFGDSGYVFETLSTSATVITQGATLTASDGSDSKIFFTAEAGGVIDIDVGTTSVDIHD